MPAASPPAAAIISASICRTAAASRTPAPPPRSTAGRMASGSRPGRHGRQPGHHFRAARKTGIYLRNGGAVTNSGTASRIFGPIAGVAINSAGMVVNDGTIGAGSSGNGVNLLAGGSVTNDGAGLILWPDKRRRTRRPSAPSPMRAPSWAGGVGVRFVGNVANTAGSNSGHDRRPGRHGGAVWPRQRPAAAATRRRLHRPGRWRRRHQTFWNCSAGTVGSIGTITGIGTSFTNFGTVSVDSGAAWTFTGTNTVGNPDRCRHGDEQRHDRGDGDPVRRRARSPTAAAIVLSGNYGVDGLAGTVQITNTGTNHEYGGPCYSAEWQRDRLETWGRGPSLPARSRASVSSAPAP